MRHQPTYALLAVPMAIMWTIVAGSPTPGTFAVGFLLGLALLVMFQVSDVAINVRRLPAQGWALAVYSLTLTRDIWFSSLDVVRRVLDPRLPLKPGVIAVSTQDEGESDYVAAFSAHSITITPGELVIAFDGCRTMYVHCLDTDLSAPNAAPAQAARLRLLRRIEGRA